MERCIQDKRQTSTYMSRIPDRRLFTNCGGVEFGTIDIADPSRMQDACRIVMSLARHEFILCVLCCIHCDNLSTCICLSSDDVSQKHSFQIRARP